MSEKDIQLMRELTEVHGPPGFEDRVYDVMEKHIREHTTDIHYDNLGSIVGKIGNGNPKVLVAGHLDEVGFLLSAITDEGFLRFKPLGGWWGHVLLSQRVNVMTQKGDLTGVIGSKAPHVLEPEERKKVMKVTDMFIDIGATSREEAEKFGVQVGDPVAPISPFEVLPNSNMLLARNWDNRAGCYIALKALERLKRENLPNTLYSGATVQEEIGLRGAGTLSHMVYPDIAFACDVTVAEDTPGMKREHGFLKLGKGPALSFMDRSMIPHRKLRQLVVNTAKQYAIPYQTDIMDGGGTDAGQFHLAHSGVPTMVISIPARYIHSHVSIIHKEDLNNAVELLVRVISQLDEQTVTEIKGLKKG